MSAANFLSILLLARFMSAAEFGVFVLAHTGLLLMTNLQNALVTQPHNILGAKREAGDYARFTGVLVLVQILASFVLCALIAMVGYIAWRYYAETFGGVLMALAGAAMPWMAQEFVRRVLYTQNETRAAALNDVVSYGLQLLGIVALMFYGRENEITASLALFVFGASSFIAVLLGVWQLREHVSFGWRDGFRDRFSKTVAEVWGFGKWLVAQSITTWMGANGHAWVVGGMLGAQAVGLYRAAIHLVNVINPLRQAAFSYLPSRGSVAFKTGGYDGLSAWVKRMSSWLFLPLFPVAFVLIVFPEQILGLVYGDKFSGQGLGIILALATVAQIIAFFRFPMEVAVLSIGSSRSLFYVNLLPVVLLATVGVALIASFGIVGVPLSGMVIGVVLLIATYVVYRRLMHVGVLSIAHNTL